MSVENKMIGFANLGNYIRWFVLSFM